MGFEKDQRPTLQKRSVTGVEVPTSQRFDGKTVYLQEKVILACGADIHDRTDEIHVETIKMFQKAAQLCDTALIGFDFICEDISKSYLTQDCAIIEANSCPSIDMHHFPVSGKVRDVAGKLLDHCFTS